MPTGRTAWSLILVLTTLLSFPIAPTAAQSTPPAGSAATPDASTLPALPQSSYDVIRLEQDGQIVPYVVWADWMPALVTTPDGGAWVFFSAQARTADGLGPRHLYASRFDPKGAAWLPAQPLPGGDIQFGPAAAVDSKGLVHLVFSDRTSDTPDALSTLVYTHTDAGGVWTPPVPVAPDPKAGHQMMPALAVDRADRVHLLWRDQRNVAAEARAALVANADVFASDLVAGKWSPPVQVDTRASADLNAGWPVLAADGDRLVALWSIYKGTTSEEMKSAVRVEWSSRPAATPGPWSKPQTLLDRTGGDTGGRSLDLAPDPRGGVVLVYGRLGQQTNSLFLRRLPTGATTWSAETGIASGDLGYLPALAVAPDGTLSLVFNSGRNRDVEVGALMLRAGADRPDPLLTLTPGEDGEHGRATLALAADGRPWVTYMHGGNGGANATEMRALRGARLAS